METQHPSAAVKDELEKRCRSELPTRLAATQENSGNESYSRQVNLERYEYGCLKISIPIKEDRSANALK